ncbi:MFS transporter [Actinocrinis puniceicyclus]|uniref:MFS transporter n=1 Tax=Actinocrinis puniceicyclus TaxID=977794 RepID=A0A8J7WSR2_9ACTN|nr:MFS transporter [Actinocrinis puniceicyclus]MBS2965444.1 MFS transporter [Actinocrinis puniceicyclus]
MTHTDTAAQRGTRTALTLAAVAVVQFMVSLDLSVVNVALPRIGSGLGFTALGLTWVINAYALTFGGLLLLGGKIADRYGHKRVLLAGLPAFGLASLAGGLAQSPGELVAARAVQGAGAAAMAPAALAVLVSTFPPGKARLRAFGVWSATNAAGGALGVLAGGLLTQYATWRWVMFINLPMVALASLLVARAVPAARRTGAPARPDLLGALLATSALTLIVLGVVRTNQYPWGSPVTIATLTAATALLAAFVLVEHTTRRDPLIRLGLFTNRHVTAANAYTLLLGGSLACAFYFMSLYLQRVLGTGPARTGAEFLPLALAVVIGSALAARLGEQLTPRALLTIGALTTTAGFAWFAFIQDTGTYTTDVLGPSIVLRRHGRRVGGRGGVGGRVGGCGCVGAGAGAGAGAGQGQIGDGDGGEHQGGADGHAEGIAVVEVVRRRSGAGAVAGRGAQRGQAERCADLAGAVEQAGGGAHFAGRDAGGGDGYARGQGQAEAEAVRCRRRNRRCPSRLTCLWMLLAASRRRAEGRRCGGGWRARSHGGGAPSRRSVRHPHTRAAHPVEKIAD